MTALKLWWQAFQVYLKPKVAAMTLLGFSAGLPYLLVYVTLTARLQDVGIKKSTIGFFAWVGLAYAFKVLWSPFVDQLKLPGLHAMFGKRRSWIGLSQLCIALGLLGMTLVMPQVNMKLFVACTLWTAFWSATQDIAIDAYRIEAIDIEFQGAMSATYVFGYRIAMLASGAGALYLAEFLSWPNAYRAMVVTMLFCFLGLWWIIKEPIQATAQPAFNGSLAMRFEAMLKHSVIDPLLDFFKRHKQAWIILALILSFRLSDISMGIMANPFYLELGFSKSDIATISKVYGLIMTIVGGFVGGVAVIRWGFLKTLLVAAVLTAITNLLFVYLSSVGADKSILTLVISADNTAGGFAMTAFVAYMSSLTNPLYTATQYALFSSLMNLTSKLLAGWSGVLVDANGFAWFFTYTAALGIPAVLLILYLMGVLFKKPNRQTTLDH